MSVLACLAGLFLVSIIAVSCLIIVLVYTDPYSSSRLIFVLFYASLMIASTSIMTLIGYLVRRISHFRRSSMMHFTNQISSSFRQGFLLSFILLAGLILQSYRILSWWNIVILIAIAGAIEWWLNK